MQILKYSVPFISVIIIFYILFYTKNMKDYKRKQYKQKNEINYLSNKINNLTHYNELTGLPNILSLYENFNKDSTISLKNKSSIMLIKIDNYKYMNDTMGNESINQILLNISKKIVSILDSNCTIYQYCCDSFIVIQDKIKSKENTEKFASRILSNFRGSIDFDNTLHNIHLNIGIVIAPDHGIQIKELIKYCEIATYRAIELGSGSYIVFDQYMYEIYYEKILIEKYLHEAIEKNEFELYYQPQLDIASNKITGLEALMRWKSPKIGFVPPDKFIKVAEDTHLIIPLGNWVLKNACAFIKKLHENGHNNLTISINISILQLLDSNFIQTLINTLQYYDIESKYIELEITESVLMESFDIISATVDKLNNIGIKIALDDFGKGYSSLSYLRQLPISTLKIDKSFIDTIHTDKKINTITCHIVKIGKSLDMCVVAEGIEKKEQLEYLRKYECNKIQGYLYSKPLPEADIINLLKTQ
ncbi:MAG: putative bifunctional diguanylate cyclase/phosphodiesterase [Eubacteriaceae bacterium]